VHPQGPERRRGLSALGTVGLQAPPKVAWSTVSQVQLVSLYAKGTTAPSGAFVPILSSWPDCEATWVSLKPCEMGQSQLQDPHVFTRGYLPP
jgi:hypothetical protein